MTNNELYHYGVKGMKWGKRKISYDNTSTTIKKGEEIHRVVPKSWAENEKKYTGHAYASYKKEDVDRYKHFARMMGGNDDNYVDMTFKARDTLVSPSEKKRVDEFIKLMDSNPEARTAMIKATRNPLVFMPKKHMDNLDDPKIADKAYKKFSYLLVSKRDIRDPYFKELEKQGYSMIIDDADRRGGISSSPIIVFDRTKSMDLDNVKGINQ